MSHRPEEFESEKALWELLGESRPAQPGPYFVQETLRNIRRAEKIQRVRTHFPSWLSAFDTRAWAVAGAAAVVAIALIMHYQGDSNETGLPGSALAASADVPEKALEETVEVSSEEFELIAYLDGLLALEENQMWTGGEEIF